LPQYIEHLRRHRHGAKAGRALRPADLFIAISALTNTNLTLLKIDVRPLQSAQLGRSQPRECCGEQERTPAAFRGVADGLDLSHSRNHDLLAVAILKTALSPLLTPRLLNKLADHIVRHPRSRQDRAEAGTNLANHSCRP